MRPGPAGHCALDGVETERGSSVAEYDAHLQRAVDATSVAKDAGETDLAAYLRDQLAEQEIETSDQEWIDHVIAGIEKDPDYMIDREPKDYTPPAE
jgi:hypothetical protein